MLSVRELKDCEQALALRQRSIDNYLVRLGFPCIPQPFSNKILISLYTKVSDLALFQQNKALLYLNYQQIVKDFINTLLKKYGYLSLRELGLLVEAIRQFSKSLANCYRALQKNLIQQKRPIEVKGRSVVPRPLLELSGDILFTELDQFKLNQLLFQELKRIILQTLDCLREKVEAETSFDHLKTIMIHLQGHQALYKSLCSSLASLIVFKRDQQLTVNILFLQWFKLFLKNFKLQNQVQQNLLIRAKLQLKEILIERQSELVQLLAHQPSLQNLQILATASKMALFDRPFQQSIILRLLNLKIPSLSIDPSLRSLRQSLQSLEYDVATSFPQIKCKFLQLASHHLASLSSEAGVQLQDMILSNFKGPNCLMILKDLFKYLGQKDWLQKTIQTNCLQLVCSNGFMPEDINKSLQFSSFFGQQTGNKNTKFQKVLQQMKRSRKLINYQHRVVAVSVSQEHLDLNIVNQVGWMQVPVKDAIRSAFSQPGKCISLNLQLSVVEMTFKGKTRMLLNGVSALILLAIDNNCVHRSQLLQHWQDRQKDFLDKKVDQLINNNLVIEKGRLLINQHFQFQGTFDLALQSSAAKGKQPVYLIESKQVAISIINRLLKRGKRERKEAILKQTSSRLRRGGEGVQLQGVIEEMRAREFLEVEGQYLIYCC